MFGTYLPPPTSLSTAANIPAATRSLRVPQEVLTDALLEEVKVRCCFVGEGLESSINARDDSMELDLPPISEMTQSESEFSLPSTGASSDMSSNRASSDFSMVLDTRGPLADYTRGEGQLQALATLYTRHSTATELHMRVVPPSSQQAGTGQGTLIIPGWVRERAAEVLFEGGDVDESSVAEVILDALLKVAAHLHALASTFLTSGLGTNGPPKNARVVHLGRWWFIHVTRFHSTLAHRVAPGRHASIITFTTPRQT